MLAIRTIYLVFGEDKFKNLVNDWIKSEQIFYQNFAGMFVPRNSSDGGGSNNATSLAKNQVSVFETLELVSLRLLEYFCSSLS